MRNSYNIGTVFFSGLACNGERGNVIIGGDRGDVEASSAFNSKNDKGEDGVVLADVSFLTTLDVPDNEVEDEIREVVEDCYASIQEETF